MAQDLPTFIIVRILLRAILQKDCVKIEIVRVILLKCCVKCTTANSTYTICNSVSTRDPCKGKYYLNSIYTLNICKPICRWSNFTFQQSTYADSTE